jgi:hypothetical protein
MLLPAMPLEKMSYQSLLAAGKDIKRACCSYTRDRKTTHTGGANFNLIKSQRRHSAENSWTLLLVLVDLDRFRADIGHILYLRILYHIPL